jgi:RNA polymerase sigma factor (sigma-70 family)
MTDAEYTRAFVEMRPKMKRWLYYWHVDSTMYDDFIQGAFLRAWELRHKYDAARGSLTTWFYHMMRTEVQSHYRRAGTQRITYTDDPYYYEGRVEPAGDEAVELGAALKAMSKLSPRAQRVMIQRARGATTGEIADGKCSKQRIDQIINTARRRIAA